MDYKNKWKIKKAKRILKNQSASFSYWIHLFPPMHSKFIEVIDQGSGQGQSIIAAYSCRVFSVNTKAHHFHIVSEVPYAAATDCLGPSTYRQRH